MSESIYGHFDATEQAARVSNEALILWAPQPEAWPLAAGCLLSIGARTPPTSMRPLIDMLEEEMGMTEKRQISQHFYLNVEKELDEVKFRGLGNTTVMGEATTEYIAHMREQGEWESCVNLLIDQTSSKTSMVSDDNTQVIATRLRQLSTGDDHAEGHWMPTKQSVLSELKEIDFSKMSEEEFTQWEKDNGVHEQNESTPMNMEEAAEVLYQYEASSSFVEE